MAEKIELSRELINQYIWKRYIDNTSNYPDVDDKEAMEILERYYARHPVNEDDECFYFGVLCFEMAWQTEDETLQARLIVKAKEILEIYRKISEEEDWDVVEDRLEECTDYISEHGLENITTVAAAQPEVVDGMILVKAGKFLFGEDSEEKFLEAFYIDIDPVSNARYREFIEDAQYRAPRIWEENPELAADELPVTGISWMDAMQFAHWANKELPSEEQWEKAARGIDGRPYPWGSSQPTPELANYRVDEPGRFGDSHLEALKGFEENCSQFGCRYTVGHVWEWTNTTFHGEGKNRVIKGGCWSDPNNPILLSAYSRLWAGVKEKSDIIGFRCSRPVGSV